MISAPGEPAVRLIVKRFINGRFSNILAKAELGSVFLMSPPRDYFTYSPSERNSIFVATGTGVAPFISMLTPGIRVGVMLHGATDLSGLYCQRYLSAKVALYIPCLSRHPVSPGLDYEYFSGTVSTYLKNKLPLGHYDFFVCGGDDMIREVTHIVDRSFSGARVFKESFA